jgi:hypothetical protein
LPEGQEHVRPWAFVDTSAAGASSLLITTSKSSLCWR